MKTSDLDIQLELLNFPRVVKVLQTVQHFPEAEKGTKEALKKGAKHLIKQGKEKLKQRMKSGKKGVTGNLLRSFMHKVKRKNRGVFYDQGRKDEYDDALRLL